MTYVRISRAEPESPYPFGAKRLAHKGKVEAVADDGTTVDISDCVASSEIVLKPGDIEKAVITIISFEVEP